MRSRLGELLGEEVASMSRLTGGDMAEAFRVVLRSGRVVFAKTHRSPPSKFFTTEAAGLAWLRDADQLDVPDVLAVSDGDQNEADTPLLALEWIHESDRRPDDAAFGRSLARLHRVGAPSFGREDRRTTGSRALPNDPCSTWTEFYAARRLEPLRRLATDGGVLPPPILAGLDTVIARLSEIGGPPEPPARLHGDLWAGNRLVDAEGRSWLIDPAAHGGHREFDLAMMQVFGGFDAVAFATYHDEFPLADGWADRVPLHQLAPLVVHAIKFGGSYRSAVDHAVKNVLGLG